MVVSQHTPVMTPQEVLTLTAYPNCRSDGVAFTT